MRWRRAARPLAFSRCRVEHQYRNQLPIRRRCIPDGEDITSCKLLVFNTLRILGSVLVYFETRHWGIARLTRKDLHKTATPTVTNHPNPDRPWYHRTESARDDHGWAPRHNPAGFQAESPLLLFSAVLTAAAVPEIFQASLRGLRLVQGTQRQDRDSAPTFHTVGFRLLLGIRR